MQLSELLQWLSTGLKTGTLVVRGAPGREAHLLREGPRHVLLLDARARAPRTFPRRIRLHHRGRAHPGPRGPAGVADPPREDPRDDRRHQGGRARGPRAAEGRRDDLRHLPLDGGILRVHRRRDPAASPWSRSPRTSPASSWKASGATTSGSASRRRSRPMRADSLAGRCPSRTSSPSGTSSSSPRSNGHRAIDQIALETHNPEFHVAKLVYDLMQTGHVVLAGEREERHGRPPSSTTPMPAADAAAAFDPHPRRLGGCRVAGAASARRGVPALPARSAHAASRPTSAGS